MSLAASKLVWQHAQASGSALVVLLALADHAGDDMTAWPSQASLAKLARVTDRQVRSILHDLVASGDIAVAGTGPRGVVIYRIACGDHQSGAATGESASTPEAGFRPEVHFRPEAEFRGDATTPEVHFRPTPEADFRGEGATPEAGFRSPRKYTSDKSSLNQIKTLTVDPANDRSGGGEGVRPSARTNATDTDRAFAAFWDRYPSRGSHPNPRKPAADIFAAAIKRGTPPGDIIRGAENFARAASQDRTDPRFIPQAVTWLRQERWTDHQRRPAPVRQDDGMC